MLSIHPELSAEDIKQIILDWVDVCESMADKCVSGGRLNAKTALTSSAAHDMEFRQYNTSFHIHKCKNCSYSNYYAHMWNIFLTKCIFCGYMKNELIIKLYKGECV